MARESSEPARLVARGTLCGLGAWAAAVALAVLLAAPLVDGLRGIGLVFLDAHFVPGPEIVAGLPPLTWFGVPATVLYLLPPIALVTGGLIAARFTRSARIGIGVRAGLAVALGYVPPTVAVAMASGTNLVVTAALAVGYALAFGAVGGLVGAQT